MAKHRDEAPFPEDPNDSDFIDPTDADESAEFIEDLEEEVDLGGTSGVEPSGVSQVEWSSLAETPDDEEGVIEELTEDSAVDLGASPPLVEDDLLLPPTSSAILNEPEAGMFVEDDLESESALAEDQAVFVTEDEVELGAPSELPRLPDVTGVNLDAEEEVLEPEVVGEASAVDLTSDEMVDPELVESSSGISITDMGIEEVPEGTGEQLGGDEIFENSGELVLEEIVQQEAGSVDLGEEVMLGEEPPSRRDLIAEAVESGVDLPGGALLSEASVESVDLEPTSNIPVDEDADLLQVMDDLGASDDHPALPDDFLSMSDDLPPPTEESETVMYDPHPEGEDSAMRTGGRIARPDSLDELEWDDGGMAGEGPVSDLSETPYDEEVSYEESATGEEVPYEEEVLFEETSYEETSYEEPAQEETWEEPEPEPVPPPTKKGKKGASRAEAQNPDTGKKPEKARGRAGAWFGGTLLGVLLGAGGLIGAGLSGYDPMPVVGNAVGIPVDERLPKPKPVTPPPPTFDDLAVALRSGNFEKAAQQVDSLPATKPEEQVLRSQIRFQSYLQKQRQAGGEVKAEDEPVKAAVEELKQANTVPAILELAYIQIETGKFDEAEQTLTQASTQFNDPRLQTALEVVKFEKSEQAKKPAPMPMPPMPMPPMPPGPMPPAPPAPPAPPEPEVNQGKAAGLDVLVLMLLVLQEPPMQPMPAQPTLDAAALYIDARKKANAGDFAGALDSLRKARTAHEEVRPRIPSGQNPYPEVDRRHTMLLMCFMQIESLLEAQAKLKNEKYYRDNSTTLAQALDAALMDAKLAPVARQVAMKLTDAKLLDAPENLLAAVDKVLADRKTNLDKITTLETDLTKATDDNKKLTTDLADAKKLGTDLQTKLTTTEKQLTDTTKQRDDLQSVVNSAAKLLFEAKVAPEKSDNAQFLAGMKEIIRFAEMKDPAATMRMLTTDLANLNRKYDSDTAQLKADKVKALADQKATHDQFVVDLKAGHTKEVNNLNTQIKESRRAAEVMPAYLKALQERGTGLEANALEDIGRVGRDPKATPVEKAGAEVIRGLVQRNRYEFTDSKETIQKGLMDLPKDSVFAVAGSKILAEVSDPVGYVKQQVKDLQARGQGDTALKLLQTTLEALPAEARPALMAERSLLQMDELRRKTGGRFQPDNPALVAAQKDADAAEAAGTPEGSYAAGRIAEEMGQFNLAIEKYREALKRHDKMDEQGALYRIALARSLVQVSQPWTPPNGTPRKPAEPGDGKTSRLDLPAGMREMLILLAVGIQPGELLGSPNRAEAQKLAEEILALEDKAPFNLRAQALAIKGDWTEALKIYAEGLRGSLPGDLSEGLLLLIRNHPDLKSPDRINPVEAERLYGQAVRLYFQRAYADAEKLLLASLEFNNQDARAFYFLGLSRLGQGKQDLAYASFEAGAQLERQSKPGAGAINSSLERVQGPERRILSQVRDRVER